MQTICSKSMNTLTLPPRNWLNSIQMFFCKDGFGTELSTKVDVPLIIETNQATIFKQFSDVQRVNLLNKS